MRTIPPETSPRPSGDSPLLQKDRRSGTVLVLTALCCLALIPMLGLAVDGANVYLMRSQIDNALNAAVLAASRSLSLGTTVAAQAASANAVAQMTFAADISGMNPNISITSYPTFQVSQNVVTGISSVTGSLSANLPLMLMGLVGFSSTSINLTATAQRRNVNIVLVLDHSGPIAGSPLSTMQADAISFVNMFVNGSDSIGLVTYTGAPYVVDALPNLDFQSNVPNDINSLQAPLISGTNTAAALSTGYAQLQNLNQPSALNVIVLFTESLPGAISGNFAGLITTATPCTPTASPLNGMLWSNQNQTEIGGLSDYTSPTENDTPETRAAAGCTATSRVPFRYLSAMPTMDIYGNSTNGTGTVSPAYSPLSLTTISAATITAAAENALDDAGNRIRSSATYPATIFVIGLGGDPGAFVPDPVLMARVANDPTSVYYNSSQPSGQYIYAPSTAQLQAAFIGIASQVLKLAR